MTLIELERHRKSVESDNFKTILNYPKRTKIQTKTSLEEQPTEILRNSSPVSISDTTVYNNYSLVKSEAAVIIQKYWKKFYNSYVTSPLKQTEVNTLRLANLSIHSIEKIGKHAPKDVHAIISVFRKPYGPWRYQYTTGSLRIGNNNDLGEQIICPGISSKYDIIITFMERRGNTEEFIGQTKFHIPKYWYRMGKLTRTFRFKEMETPTHHSMRPRTPAECNVTVSLDFIPGGELSASGTLGCCVESPSFTKFQSIAMLAGLPGSLLGRRKEDSAIACLTQTQLICFNRLDEMGQRPLYSIRLESLKQVYSETEITVRTRNPLLRRSSTSTVVKKSTDNGAPDGPKFVLVDDRNRSYTFSALNSELCNEWVSSIQDSMVMISSSSNQL